MNLKQIKNQCKLLISTVGIISFLGCSSTKEEREIPPPVPPEENISIYDNALKDFGKMLAGYNVPTTRIMNKPIENLTGSKNLPSDLSRMLSSTMGKIGKRILFIEYSPRFLEQEFRLGTNIDRILPDILIVGGITEYDKSLIVKDSSGASEGEYKDFSAVAEVDAESKISRLAIDMNITDYKSLISLQCNVTNKMKIFKSKSGFNFGFFFMANGINITSNFSRSQGKEASLRRLIELSTLQTLGKYFEVPYWKTIPGASKDKDMLENLKEKFIAQPTPVQIRYIKEYLYLNMYDNINRENDEINQLEMNAINHARKQFKTKSDVDLYLALWENIPIEKSRKRADKLEAERLEKERIERERSERERSERERSERERSERKKIAGIPLKIEPKQADIDKQKQAEIDKQKQAEIDKQKQAEIDNALKNADEYAKNHPRKYKEQINLYSNIKEMEIDNKTLNKIRNKIKEIEKVLRKIPHSNIITEDF